MLLVFRLSMHKYVYSHHCSSHTMLRIDMLHITHCFFRVISSPRGRVEVKSIRKHHAKACQPGILSDTATWASQLPNSYTPRTPSHMTVYSYSGFQVLCYRHQRVLWHWTLISSGLIWAIFAFIFSSQTPFCRSESARTLLRPITAPYRSFSK